MLQLQLELLWLLTYVVAVVLTLLLQTVIVTSSLAVNSAHLPTKSPIALPRTKHPLV